jgi:hypothetical protein
MELRTIIFNLNHHHLGHYFGYLRIIIFELGIYFGSLEVLAFGVWSLELGVFIEGSYFLIILIST